MTKERLFMEYKIDSTHSKWEPIDDFMSVELFRFMHGGALPTKRDTSLVWLIQFLNKIRNRKWMKKHLMVKPEWGSMYLTAKRMLYRHADEVLKEQ